MIKVIRSLVVLFLAAQQSTIDLSKMEFVKIDPGIFRMGCSEGDTNCDPDENPPHQVRITKSFELGKYEVTQAQWLVLMPNNPSRFKGENLPVESISFVAVQEFLSKMNARKDGYTYRLPSEAEWEFAARAGTATPNTGTFNDIAWYQQNSGGMSHPVGQKKPNAWGLHDMEGNVYEWTNDWFFDYEEDPQADPRGPETGYERVPRGGSWESTPKGIRTSNRNMLEPDEGNYNIGFRLARVRVQ
jgi:formylglycine-generating enzyme required for sulfatase activity